MGNLAIKTDAGRSQRSAGPVIRPVTPHQSPQVSSILRNGGSRRLQTKLRINTPGDKYEQEADRVAEQVMRMPEPWPSSVHGDSPPVNSRIPRWRTIQRVCASCVEDDELLQAKAAAGSETTEVTPATSSRIQSLQGGGRSLPGTERNFFEPRFGTDFSALRIHSDTQADRLARSVNARAFTLGRNVVFAAGEYSPGSSVGRKLLAHELTHVIQQMGAQSKIIFRQEFPIDENLDEPQEGFGEPQEEVGDQGSGFDGEQPTEKESVSDECREEWALIEEGLGSSRNCLEVESLLWETSDLVGKASRLEEEKTQARGEHDELNNRKQELEKDLEARQSAHNEKLAPLLETRKPLIENRDSAKALYDQASDAVTEPHTGYWSKFQQTSQEIERRDLLLDWLVSKGTAEHLSIVEVLSLPLVMLAYAKQIEKVDQSLKVLRLMSVELEWLAATEMDALRAYRQAMDELSEIENQIAMLEASDPTEEAKRLNTEIGVITETIDRLTKDIQEAIDKSGESRWNAEDAGSRCAEAGAFEGHNIVFALEAHMIKCYDVSF